MNSKNIVCPLCKSDSQSIYTNLVDTLYHVPGYWTITQCTTCKLCWLDQTPKLKDIPSFYKNYHTHNKNNIESIWIYKIIALGIPAITMGYRNFLNTKSEIILGFILSLIGPIREIGQGTILWLHAKERGKLLDAGCGSGILLKKLQRLGWDVYGIEPDNAAATQAISIIGKKRIFPGYLNNQQLKKNSFDFITLIHVIEHLPHPGTVLQQCFSLLKPNGKLIIATPNSNSLGSKLFRQFWRGWEPPRHIFIYNKTNLAKLIRENGFIIQKIKTPCNATVIVVKDSILLKYKNKANGKKITCFKIIIMFILISLIWMLEYALTMIGLPWGETVHLVAKKPGFER